MNSHPRFSCNYFYKQQQEHAKHQCTLCMGTHAPFQCARVHVNNGKAKPNWARKEIKLAADQNRNPDLQWTPPDLPPLPLPLEPPQDVQQHAAPEDTAPLCAAAVAMHGPPPMSNFRRQPAACPAVFEERHWQENLAEKTSYPNPGFHMSGNLWNLDIADRSTKPAPLASFLRHVTSMPNQTYSSTDRHPVTDIQHLRTEPTLDNIAAQHCSSSSLLGEIAVRAPHPQVMVEYGARSIAGKVQQVHSQLMRMIQTMQHGNNPQPKARAWAEHSTQLPPRPAHPTPQPPTMTPSSRLQHLELKVHPLRV